MKVISKKDYERFITARNFTMANRQNSFGAGFVNKFKGVITTEHILEIMRLDKEGTAWDVKEYIAKELIKD